MSMKRSSRAVLVAHLTTVHRAYDTRIFIKECQTLARAGYEVKLIAPHPTTEVVKDVRIVPIPKPSSRTQRMLWSVWRAFAKALVVNASIYHIHDPELLVVAWLLRGLGKTVVYDVHEDLPLQILSKPWISPPLRRIIAGLMVWVEQFSAVVLSGIVAATPAIARKFPANKTVIVQNFPLVQEPLPTYDSSPHEPVVAYVGGISDIRGVREMVTAMSMLPPECDTRLVLVGEFTPSFLEEEVRKLPGFERVEFLRWRSQTEVAAILRSARAGLVLFHPVPNHMEAQPNKLFEYMSAALPVIASDFPLWRAIIDNAECGILVDPLDPEAICTAVGWIVEHPAEAAAMGNRGREAVLSKYNWEAEAPVLIALYRRLSKRGG